MGPTHNNQNGPGTLKREGQLKLPHWGKIIQLLPTYVHVLSGGGGYQSDWSQVPPRGYLVQVQTGRGTLTRFR